MIDFEPFNKLKNQGLYVDDVDGKWSTPLEFKQIDYDNCKRTISLLRGIFWTRTNYFLNVSDADWLSFIEVLNENVI